MEILVVSPGVNYSLIKQNHTLVWSLETTVRGLPLLGRWELVNSMLTVIIKISHGGSIC